MLLNRPYVMKTYLKMVFKILFLLFANFTFAQLIHIQGRLISENNIDSLSYAMVNVKGKNISTITNRAGSFFLSGNLTLGDSIVFSHIAYEPKTVTLSEFKETGNIIKLLPKIYTLDEVAIVDESAVNKLKKALDVSKSNLNLPIRLETYYREFVKENNQYTKFSDGLIDFELSGNTENFKTKVFVKQSRAIELKTEENKDIDWDINSPLDIKNMAAPFFFNALSELIENADNYEFYTSYINDKNLKDYITIKFTPKAVNKELLYQGEITIDQQSKYILSYSIGLEQTVAKTPKVVNMLILKGQIKQKEILVLFQTDNGNYRPWYANKRIAIRVWNNKKMDLTFSFSSDLLVNQVVNGVVKSRSPNSVYTKKSLYPLGNNYQSIFWEKQNAIQLTPEEEKIIDQLK